MAEKYQPPASASWWLCGRLASLHHIPHDITFSSFLLLPPRLVTALDHLGTGVGGVDGGVGARPRLRRPALTVRDAARDILLWRCHTVNTQNTTKLDRAQHPEPRQTVHHQHRGEEGASTLFYWINCIDIVVKMNQLFQFREETYIFSLFLVSIYIYLLLPHFSIYLQYLLLRFIIFQIPSKLNRSKKPNNNNATTETF